MVKLQLVTMTNNNPGYFLYISTLVLHVVDRQGRKLEHGYKWVCKVKKNTHLQIINDYIL